MLICPSPVIDELTWYIKMQNAFTYSVITGNISNSLKNEKLATGVSQCFCVAQW